MVKTRKLNTPTDPPTPTLPPTHTHTHTHVHKRDVAEILWKGKKTSRQCCNASGRQKRVIKV